MKILSHCILFTLFYNFSAIGAKLYVKNIDELNFIIEDICDKLNLSKIELCIAYINSCNWINKYLIGIDNYEHLIFNYNIINKDLTLSEKDINHIKEKIKNIDKLLLNPAKWIFD